MHASQDAPKYSWTLLPILPWQNKPKSFVSLESSEKVSHTVRRSAHMPECFQYLYLINHMSGLTLLFNITVLHWSPTQRIDLSPLYSIVHSVHHSQTEHRPDPVNLDSEGAHKHSVRKDPSLFIDYKVHFIWGYKIKSSSV